MKIYLGFIFLLLINSKMQSQSLTNKVDWFCGFNFNQNDTLMKVELENSNILEKKKFGSIPYVGQLSERYFFSAMVKDNFLRNQLHSDSARVEFLPGAFSPPSKLTKHSIPTSQFKILRVTYYFNDSTITDNLYLQAIEQFSKDAKWKKILKRNMQSKAYYQKGKLIQFEGDSNVKTQFGVYKKFVNNTLVGLIVENWKSSDFV